MIYDKLFFALGALFGLIAFSAGAFGSHLLRNRLPADRLQVFEIGVRYQMYHALALITLANYVNSAWVVMAGWLFILGILIFSGSLYVLVLSNQKKWGAITPIGGAILLMGWLLLVIGGLI